VAEDGGSIKLNWHKKQYKKLQATSRELQANTKGRRQWSAEKRINKKASQTQI
jgi:hypothetical protein